MEIPGPGPPGALFFSGLNNVLEVWADSISVMMLAFNVAEAGSIPGTTCGPSSTAWSEHRARNKS